QESLDTRSYTEALLLAEKRGKQLSGVAVATPEKISVAAAVKEWLDARGKEGTKNEKAITMSKKLLEWCGGCKVSIEKLKGGKYHIEETSEKVEWGGEKIIVMSSITPAHLRKFYYGLPFKTGTSSSLKVHWSVLGGLFRWAVSGEILLTNPMKDAAGDSRFIPKFKKPPVEVPEPEDINKVLAIESTRLFASLLRFTGLAMLDACTLKRSALTDGNLISGHRRKTGEAYRVRIPMQLADELRALPPVNATYFFWDGKGEETSLTHLWRMRLTKTFE